MLQIKLVDAKDNSPISGIQINVNGKTDNPEKYYNIAGEPMKPAPLNSHWEREPFTWHFLRRKEAPITFCRLHFSMN